MNGDEVRVLPEVSHEIFLLLKRIKAVVFDFDGVFTDNTVLVNQNGVESVRCWRSDGLGLVRVRALGLETLILSTELNNVVAVRADKLKTKYIQGVDDKAKAIIKWSQEVNIPLSDVAFIGNDINDVPALKEVGLPIGVADSYDDILPFIKYRTCTAGGYGAVREVCDLIVKTRSKNE